MTSSAECAENAEARMKNTPSSPTIPGRAFSSPFCALLWREWRASRWSLLLAATAPAAAYRLENWYFSSVLHRNNFTYVAPGVFALFALGLGAGLFASETAGGTAHFREERPVERSAVWNAKLLMPLCALLVGVVLYCIASAWLFPNEAWLTEQMSKLDIPMIASAAVLFMFASATLCSVLLDRSITAFGAGGALAAALAVGQTLLLEKAVPGVEWLSRYPTAILAIPLFVEGVLVLLLSRLVFIRWTRD